MAHRGIGPLVVWKVAAVTVVVLVATPAHALTLSGEVRCADCAGGVGLVALEGEGGFPLAHLWLDRPGPYGVDVPDFTESVELYAFRDDDADGLPDPGTEAVPHPDNPIVVEGEDLAGLDIEIPTLPDVDVELSGTIACADCAGGVGLVVRGAADGFPLAHMGLAAPGRYAVSVPIGAGEVEVWAYRDADGNGIADPGTELTACDRNPIDVGSDDIFGLDVDMGSLPDVTAALSGRVRCADCAGGVGLIVLAVEGGFPLAHIGLDVAGPFSVEVPFDSGEVELWAYRDADRDGVPDPGTEPKPFDDNPVTVARDDIEGLDVTLAPLPDVTAEVSGRVRCADCAGGVGLVATTSPRFGGFPLAHLGLAEPGDYVVSLPIDSGEVSLYAYRDADLDGVPDPGTDLVEYPDNPIVVLDDDVEDIDLDLGELPPLPAVELSGVVTCGDCAGVNVIVLSAEGGFPLAHLGLDGPGPWAAEVPEAIGAVEVWAFRDDDLDGVPDPGTAPRPTVTIRPGGHALSMF